MLASFHPFSCQTVLNSRVPLFHIFSSLLCLLVVPVCTQIGLCHLLKPRQLTSVYTAVSCMAPRLYLRGAEGEWRKARHIDRNGEAGVVCLGLLMEKGRYSRSPVFIIYSWAGLLHTDEQESGWLWGESYSRHFCLPSTFIVGSDEVFASEPHLRETLPWHSCTHVNSPRPIRTPFPRGFLCSAKYTTGNMTLPVTYSCSGQGEALRVPVPSITECWWPQSCAGR